MIVQAKIESCTPHITGGIIEAEAQAYWNGLFVAKTVISPCKRNYCIIRKELLAVVEAVKHFHHYIYGVETVVRTDHGALTWLMNFKNIEGRGWRPSENTI